MRKTQKLVYAALAGAIAFILVKVTAFPIFPAATYLKMELSEVPLLLLASTVSPWVGLAATFVKGVLRWWGGGNVFGVTSDFLFGMVFVCTFGAVLRKRSGWKPIVQASLVALAARLLFCIPANLIILKLQYGQSPAEVMAIMFPFLLPFNFLKGALNILCFCPIYLRMRSFFLRSHPAAEKPR